MLILVVMTSPFLVSSWPAPSVPGLPPDGNSAGSPRRRQAGLSVCPWCDPRGTYSFTRTLSQTYKPEVRMDVIRILIAILLPPLGVFLQVGIGLHFWLNILLTLLGYIPGIIHAIWVILRK
jgi:uncharacterized membrane protein YqaE (UPF0057 family)